MNTDRALVTTVLVPEDAVLVEVVAWSSTDLHAGVSATVIGESGEYRLTVHTIVRTGERFSPSGFAHGTATDARTLASSAVWGFLASKLPPITSEDERPAAQAAAREVERQAEDAAALMSDPSRWMLRRVFADGDEFVLHVHPFPDGFAAFADLGSEVITMGGPTLPERLTLHRRKAQGRRLLPN